MNPAYRASPVAAMADHAYPVRWTGQQAVVTLPRHIGTSNAGEIRGQLLWIINRGAVVLVADLTGTVSCDGSGAEALARAHGRATANGTELRLVVAADAVRRALTRNGFDRSAAVYPDLDAALAAGTGQREQGARSADPGAGTEDLLDVAVAGVFDVGLILRAAIDLPPDATARRITEALGRLDDVIRDIRSQAYGERGHGAGPGPAQRPRPPVLERTARARIRSELLQRHVAQTAHAVRSAATDTAALLERRAGLLRQPGRVDYPTDIKKWRAIAEEAGKIAERWEPRP